MIDPELLEMLESEVTIALPTSDARTSDGKRTMGTPAPYRAHVEARRDMVRNASGEEVLASGFVYLDAAYPSIKESAKLTLPDGRTPTILAVETTYGTDGPYQTVIAW